ncbi:MAG: family 16 glycosylhydrolase [Trueperaceae bacterium]|nr:family 16 glycosylhydrolase [Trueperaceae bacterium]
MTRLGSARQRSRRLLASLTLLLALCAAQSQGAVQTISDLTQGAPAGLDGLGNGIGYVTWQDGGGTSIDLSTVDVEPGDDLALPDQTGTESVLRVEHNIISWGGFTHAFSDDAFTNWVSRDYSAYEGMRFWFLGTGSGMPVQLDLFDNRNPDLPGDSAERWAFRFNDDSPEWKLVEVPFTSFQRRSDFQPGGAPNDGLGLDQMTGWALGFQPGHGVSHVARVEAYGDGGVVAEGVLTVSFASPVARVTEGDQVEFSVVLSEASEEAVSVRVFVRADSAAAFRDFVPVNELLVFPPGVTEVTFSLDTLQDSRQEGEERALAILDGPRGAQLGFQRRAIVVIEDDDPLDPDLIADFGSGDGGFVGTGGTSERVVETIDTAAAARPGQDRFEHMLAFTWQDEAALEARFGMPLDASHAEGLEFWYRGDGTGHEVTVTVLGARDEDRPWELVWSDEFDAPAGTQPDTRFWNFELGDGAPGNPGWGNAERQMYTRDPANVSMDGDGNLVIRALETGGDAPMCYYGNPCEYTSARITTAGKVEPMFGRIEARIKLPFGQGIWPAFWMLGNDFWQVSWPASGEIDIMEYIGKEPYRAHGSFHGPGHFGGNSLTRSTSLPDGAPIAEDYRIFAVEWAAGTITWYLDDVAYSTYTAAHVPAGTPWVGDHPYFLILNLAIGGYWPGYPDETTVFPQEMLVDYVRVYSATDTSERYEASFVDDADGWTLVRLPFSEFSRSTVQAEGAPNTDFARTALWGLDIGVIGGAGSAMIDQVRLYLGD